MRPEPLSGVGRLLRLLRARGMFVPGDVCARDVRRVFVPALCFLGLRCADAGHPPGLFTVRGCSQIFCKIKYVSELNER